MFGDKSLIVVHTYLEHHRIWTANCKGPWVFDTISTHVLDTTGISCNDPSLDDRPISEPYKTLTLKIVGTAFEDMHEGLVPPRETSHISNSRHESISLRIIIDTWKRFDYILCMYKKHLELLDQLLFQILELMNCRDRKWNGECIKLLSGFKNCDSVFAEDWSREKNFS